MRARWRKASAAAILAVTLACDPGLVPEQDLSFDPLQGEWVACLNDGVGDYSTLVRFFPDASFGTITRTYATNDGSCGGAETSSSYVSRTYQLVGDVTASIGPAGLEVVAKQMNIESSFDLVYTIVYVDTQATPQVLYFGDLALDPVEDGTSSEKRPDVLAVSTALTSQ